MPIKTELNWDGKYDAEGKRVAPLRVALPFQTVETVNESSQDRSRNLFQAASQAKPWRNRLIWGDKKYVLPSLLSEFAGKVNLIYIDPPFDTGADFSFTAEIPDAGDLDADPLEFTKQASLIEQKAYRDTWGRGLDSYVNWFYQTSIYLSELLAENGSIYVHIGPNMSHYCKIILDEIFGSNNYVNEIIWRRAFGHSDSGRCGIIHDVILLYGKSNNRTWNRVLHAPNAEYIERFFDGYDEKKAERYQRISLSAGGLSGGGYDYEYKGVRANWRCPLSTLERYDQENRLHWPKKGVPRLKRYESEYEGAPLQDIWTDLNKIHNQSQELIGYPTQKPESLLDRIVRSSSNEGDLILDCFAGSGTTAIVAEKLNRRWIGCDLGRFSIHTTRKRLLSIPDVRPFVVQNLGKYERQVWQAGIFGPSPETAAEASKRHKAYVDFILGLYHATPISGHSWLHGVRKGRMVHVGAVDAPVSVGDVKQVAIEFKRAIGTGKDAPTTNGIDVLGWDFAFEINEVAKQQAAAANIQMQFKRIPRDVMDKRAVDQGDIHFFEMAALEVDAKTKGLAATLTLANFVIHPDDVPEEVRRAVKHWSQWIDYWAVDWDNHGDAFHNEWQAFRTRKDTKLAMTATRTYDEPGDYRAVVKVIDILGNDTTKTVTIKVKK